MNVTHKHRTMTDETTNDVQKQVHSGVSIKGKTVCGDGTRDQHKLTIKGKGEDADEAIAAYEEALDAAEDGNWAHRGLQLNPDREEDVDESDEQ